MAKVIIFCLVLTISVLRDYYVQGLSGQQKKPSNIWNGRVAAKAADGFQSKLAQPNGGISRNTRCTAICINFLKYLSNGFKGMQQTKVIHYVVGKAERFCQLHNIEDLECHNFMKKSHLVAQLIEKGLKARQICIQLGYCSKGVQHLPSSLSNKMPVVTKHIKENFRLTNIHKEAITCRVCGIVKNSITKSFAVSIVEMADVKINLTDLCNVLHDKSAKFKCVCAVSVLKVMETNVGKKLIPSLCESTKCTGLRLPFNLPLRDRESCESCKKITSLVEEQLKYFDWIVSKILKDVSSICREFYDEATFKRCDAIVKKTKTIMLSIEERLNPNGVCRALGMCKSEEKETKPETELNNLTKRKLATKEKPSRQRMRSSCPLCKVALKFIKRARALW